MTRPKQPSLGRRLFHDQTGNIDFSRMLEQLIPSIAIGAIVIYANNIVTQYQVSDLRTDVASIKQDLRSNSVAMSTQNNEIVRLQAAMTAYLGQQTQLNAAMDARLTYLERADSRRR